MGLVRYSFPIVTKFSSSRQITTPTPHHVVTQVLQAAYNALSDVQPTVSKHCRHMERISENGKCKT